MNDHIVKKAFFDELEKTAFPIMKAIMGASYISDAAGQVSSERKKLKQTPTAGDLSKQMNYPDY